MTDMLALLKQRSSANKFATTRALSREEIKELVSSATETPSSYNIQPWRFVAVTTPEAKRRLKAVAYNQQKVEDASVTFIVLGDLHGYQKLAEVLGRSVTAGTLEQRAADGWVRAATKSDSNNPQFARDEVIRSASLAAMTLMLAAEAKGLVSGPMIGFDPAGVKREFNIPERYVPALLLPVGYTAPGNGPRRPRLTAEEVLTFNEGREF